MRSYRPAAILAVCALSLLLLFSCQNPTTSEDFGTIVVSDGNAALTVVNLVNTSGDLVESLQGSFVNKHVDQELTFTATVSYIGTVYQDGHTESLGTYHTESEWVASGYYSSYQGYWDYYGNWVGDWIDTSGYVDVQVEDTRWVEGGYVDSDEGITPVLTASADNVVAPGSSLGFYAGKSTSNPCVGYTITVTYTNSDGSVAGNLDYTSRDVTVRALSDLAVR